MSKSVKKFSKRQRFDDYEEYDYDNFNRIQHLKEKRLQAALRSKSKYSLLDVLDED